MNTEQMKINRVIISGGGSGGHIFPAVAIADEIKRRNPEVEILFVGANGKMEMERVPNAGYKIIGLDIVGSIVGIVKQFGSEGLVGLVAIWVLWGIYSKK